MFSNRFAFVLLGMMCVAAAAGGGYLATRQNAVPTPAAASEPGAPAAQNAVATGTVAPATAARPLPTDAAVDDTARSGKRADTTARTSATELTRAANAASVRRDTPSPNRSTANNTSAQGNPGLTSQPLPPPPAPEITPAPRQDDRVAQEPSRAPEPPQKSFEELVLPSDSVIGLQTETRISSETARVEDRVEARVTRDVRVAGTLAIPLGSRVIGTVTVVERGGKFKDAARIGIKFNTLVLGDGTRMPMNTETIFRQGETPDTAAKVGGGAVVGTILGAIFGGGKGAAVGAVAGAGSGAAAVATGERSIVTLPVGTPLTLRITSPLTVIVEQK